MTLRASPILLAALGVLSACGMLAPAPAPVEAAATPEERLVAALEAEGCVLTRDNVGAVLLRASLTQAELPGLTSSLQSQGRLEAAGGDAIRVLSPNCI